MRLPPCVHDPVFSGHTNSSRQYAYICTRCGQSGWSQVCDVSRVNADEYYRQRVIHGWHTSSEIQGAGLHLHRRPSRASHVRIPAPPRVPRIIHPGPSLWYPSVVVLGILALICGMDIFAGSLMQRSTASIAAGVFLLAAVIIYVIAQPRNTT